ncbi:MULTISPECIES: DUF5590 domain-containing protein [Vagococcus]|uniref:cell wall elongation regulator TseB-like domain-containing protein n=1 Tax=Vagococcus TaxID=2737 RepID=UPI002FCBA085
MNKRSNRQVKILGLILILAVVLISLVLFQSASPMRKAKKEGIKIAQSVADIQQVDEFYWFTREKTYFTVVGEDKNQVEKVVFLPQDGSEALVMEQKEGLTDKEAIQKVLDLKETSKIKKVSLGIYDNKPTWEIVAKSKDGGIVYYLIDFKNGDVIKKID